MLCEPRDVSTDQIQKTGRKRRATDSTPKRSKIEPGTRFTQRLQSVENGRVSSEQQPFLGAVSQSRQRSSPAGVYRSPDAGSASQTSSTTERQQQRFGANNSAVGFAANVFGDPATSQVAAGDISSIPGHDKARHTDRKDSNYGRPTWSLIFAPFPDAEIVNALTDVYFERVNWFICIMHEPSFRRSKDRILSSQTWYREDMGTVLLCMAISAMALQCVARDPAWSGHSLLGRTSLAPKDFADMLMKEIRYHLFDLVDDCCIETVQVCSLLGTYSIFYASPSLAWGVVGLAVRTAYGLSLHCDQDSDQEWDPVTAQVRRRNWLHLNVADIFASMIYGRPISLDPAFSRVAPLQDLDDTIFGPNLSRHPLMVITTQHPLLSSSTVTLLTFHVLKHQLYDIVHQALCRYRVLRFQSPMSVEDMSSLIRAVHQNRKAIATWKSQLPPVFECEPGSRQSILDELNGITDTDVAFHLRQRHHIHTPPGPRASSAKGCTSGTTRKSAVAETLHLAVEAAVRMSNLPIDHFKIHTVMPFMLMNLFTAGVVLCIPPSAWPLSNTAQEAKAATLRIIKQSRSLKDLSPIAHHTEQLLTRLLKICLEQEVENSLRQESSSSSRQSEEPGRPVGSYRGQDIVGNGRLEESAVQNTQYPWTSSHPAAAHAMNASRDDHLQQSDTTAMLNEPMQHHEYSQMDPSWSWYQNESQFQHLHAQMDETVGNFGQMLFNLVPNDPIALGAGETTRE
ncbi:uncharacterized protein AB675_10709 [Cyphellophora attinorum]|uniref:Xylanolytic transcriptional activator regulatory domain-containing protein n=1 Tax=Cyphellophora attinorum TaxID=1664694 RepID=A0A0N1HUP5_9EURO|nr:uncharacterized protein AB675_10709 [Phialophora attinorum]KPI40745.1 hypothetical protein AB675_10709 [Phialophora attinorum]